jgi:hypothetical protein
MGAINLFLLSAIAGCFASIACAQEPAKTELVITVHFPDGTPAKGIKIQQIQLERTSPRPRNYLCGATDGNGQLAVKFAPMRSMDDDRNGYGLYRYVLMPENLRWEMSDLYYWNKNPWTDEVMMETDIWSYEAYFERMHSAEASHDNWSVGKLVRIAAGESAHWNVTLQQGREVQVSVVDQFNQPLAHESFSVFLDAGVLSHTGYGGEVPVTEVKTDEQGRFALPRAGEFYYSFKYNPIVRTADLSVYCAPDTPYLSFLVTGRFDQSSGGITYFKRVPKLLAMIARDKITQHPISEVAIRAFIDFGAGGQDGPVGKTDQDGRFTRDPFFTEGVVKLIASKEGYADFVFDMKSFVSGETLYFDMEPKKQPTSLFRDEP